MKGRKKMKRNTIALITALCMLFGAAAADTVSFSGTVEASDTWQVYAPIGGTAEEVPVIAGENVRADTVIARVKTTRIYASQSGTVTAVYGQPGESAESVTALYGAVMYLEGETLYTVSATTEKAYDQKDNYVVHSGEQVWVVSRNHTTDSGTGIITSVTESGYTVRITSGDFYIGDTLDIFRNESGAASGRIGRGTVARVAPVAVTGTGSIVSCAVKAGDAVKQGQLLFETVNGSFDGDEKVGTEIVAGMDGVISTLNVEKGGSINENSVIAVIYPKETMRVAVNVPELDLKELRIGQKVLVELDWNQDDGVTYEGTVEMISGIGTTGSENPSFKAYVSFVPDENTRYGMSALVTTLEEEETASDQTEDVSAAEEKEGTMEKQENPENVSVGDEQKEQTEDTENPGKGPRGERPEGMTPGERPQRTEGEETLPEASAASENMEE